MITLRKAEPGDLPDVFKLICELEQNSGEAMDFAAFEPVYLRNCRDPSILYLLAVDDNQTVGFGSLHVQSLLHHCGPVAEVQELVVKEGNRGGGVGRALLTALEVEAARRGCRQIELCCNRERAASDEFYGHRGYRKTHFKHVKKLDQ